MLPDADSESSVRANAFPHIGKVEMVSAELPSIVLVGTGVVGRAILKAHIDAGVSVCVTDQDATSMKSAVDQVMQHEATGGAWKVAPAHLGEWKVLSIAAADYSPTTDSFLVIESIPERLDIKQAFFRSAEENLGEDAVLCSNTSTLRIHDIANGTSRPDRICGMHFFMPVAQRDAVEIVRTDETSSRVVDVCKKHVQRINKTPLVVQDQPGFVVNRLLSPYLNQSLLLLAHGISAARLEKAAIAYGMPMSPLELIDWIGTRTMFDAGRSFWQAFPTRIDPSPIVPALIKKKRSGRSTGAGLYDYEHGIRSEQLSAAATTVIDKYRLDRLELTDAEIIQLLAIPMWIEATLAAEEGVVGKIDDFDTAMHGGLGYSSTEGWIGFFRSIGIPPIEKASARWSDQFRSMSKPSGLDLGKLANMNSA